MFGVGICSAIGIGIGTSTGIGIGICVGNIIGSCIVRLALESLLVLTLVVAYWNLHLRWC